MQEKSRLKERMIRDLVQENLDVARGVPRHRSRSRDSKRAGGWILGALIVALVAFFSGSIGTTSAGARRKALADGSLSANAFRPAPGPVLPAAPVAAAAEQTLPAPRAIDPKLFQLAVRKIVVDPGHGGGDPGAMTRAGLSEKDITLDIAQRLATLLRTGNLFGVVLTRDHDESVSLEQRVQIANREKADLFVSIHVNSIPLPERFGVETYYLGSSTDPSALRLAHEENSGSGYSLSDFKTLLEGVYVDVRHDESRRLAEDMQSGLYRRLHVVTPALENRGVKTAPLVVLVGTQMPAILAEVSCISNGGEARRLSTPSYRQEIAQALRAGVESYVASRAGSPAPAAAAAGS
ncbi:MAG: N-acetylmuramoyl-L-alanine amidase family protein [Thermoanaerobaculia bacterium]